MAHHEPATGSSGNDPREHDVSRVRARVETKPPRVSEARDALFDDADQHGPRWPVLVRRAVPVLLLLPAAISMASLDAWRSPVLDALEFAAADLVLVAPVLVLLVVLAGALAPLARASTFPLLAGGFLLLAGATGLVDTGRIVLASVPAAVGALLLGIAAARSIRRAVWLLPLLLAAGLSDARSVQGGVTRRLLDDAAAGGAATEQLSATVSVSSSVVAPIDYLVLHLPAATGTWMLGLVDVAALGLLLGLAHLYWLPTGRTIVALSVALVLTVGVGMPVPVLPMLGIAWVVVHARLVWQATRFSARRLVYLGG